MDYLELLKHRVSTRKFLEDQITEKELSIILLAANGAPVGSNMYRDIHLTVVQNREILDKLSQAGAKRSEDKKRMKEIAGDTVLEEDNGKPVTSSNPFYRAPTVIFVSHKAQGIQIGIEYSNVACVVFSMHLAAAELGLGSVFMWHALESMREIPELDNAYLLNLPEGFTPLLGIAVGYPASAPRIRELQAEKIKTNYIL
ncbi:MAG: nitroreductase family protein [Treponema sp.]|jgi:nitroreductase|nr:nitroreductase family protein [Treponema sp.]